MAKKSVKSRQAQSKPGIDALALKKLKIILGIIIAVFAFLLYANTINHDFTLDDHPAIDDNKVTTLGLAGIPTLLKTDYWYGYKDELRGPVYRPASLVLFAIVWQFIPDNPHVYHFLNVLLYALTCLVLFLVLCQLFKKYNLVLPFVCTLLYAGHPIHSEVVNNIKSMDEMLCLLFGLTSMLLIFKYISTKSVSALVLGSLCFFFSLISKETGIAFLATVPLAIYFFDDASFKKHFNIIGILLAITGVYLIIRLIVLSDVHQHSVTANVLNNTLFGAHDVGERYATVFYILVRYVFLLIFPHPLTCDYNYSQIAIQNLYSPGAMLGTFLFLGLGIYSLIHFRKYNFLVFGFLFFVIMISPVSNFFFLNGSTMAERFLYMPSLGFCIILAYGLVHFTRTEIVKTSFRNLSQFFSNNLTLFLIVVVITLSYSFKTIARNGDWKNNITIFSHDVNISQNSATAHSILGGELLKAVENSPNSKNKSDTLQLAKHHLKKALEIYPNYAGLYATLGYIYYQENNFDSAFYYQSKELETGNKDFDLKYNYAKTLNKLSKYDEAITILNELLSSDPKHEGANYNLALAYTNKGDLDKGLYYFSKVIEVNPKRGDAYYYSGLILRAKGDVNKANEYLNKATSLGFRQ